VLRLLERIKIAAADCKHPKLARATSDGGDRPE
jgi:hypothetical protein